MENTENVVLSRSVCYAMLAALAIALLVQANAAAGAYPWSAAQFAGISGFHLSQLVTFIRLSAATLREQLHNTWLFLYVFAVVWAIVLTWALFERHRLKLGVSRRDLYWMGWMTLSVMAAAIGYGAGTNGLLARQYPKGVPVTDALALAFVLALPVFAWKRLQQGRESGDNSNSRALYTSLHLNDNDMDDDVSVTRPRVPFQETSSSTPPEGMNLQTLQVPAPDAAAVAAMNKLLESTVEAVTRQQEPAMVTAPEPVAVVAASGPKAFQNAFPETLEPVAAVEAFAAPEAAAAPLSAASAKDFREQLKALNESWAKIENAGQEIEEWFDVQREQVIAHLRMHPRGRGGEMALSTQTDFLSERLEAVDTEWAAIRRSTLEIARWFGDVPGARPESKA